jgi:hypothetical protein
LPSGADAYAGYVDGIWVTVPALKARFPHTPILSLTVFPGVVADGADCEAGDLTVPQLAGWLRWRLDAGQYRPVGYAGAANMQAVLNAIAGQGIMRSSVRLWSAHYGAGKHICGPSTCGYPQADATQWTDRSSGLGGSLVDESLLPSWFFPCVLRSGDDMIYLPNGAGATAAFNVPAGSTQLQANSNSPAALQYMTDDSGTWVPWPIDHARAPNSVSVTGAVSVKVQRTDAGAGLVCINFA